MQKRQERLSRAINRAVNRYAEPFDFHCDNTVLSISAYKSRPTYIEDSELGRRVVAGYEITIGIDTFNSITNLAGDALFNGSCFFTAKGEGCRYYIDKLTPFTSLALESGYRIFVKKVKNDPA